MWVSATAERAYARAAFSWRVLDAQKAKALSDKKSEPSLIDPQAGVQLVVPSLEKIGQVRQSSTPEAGKSYWMAFSNRAAASNAVVASAL